MRGFIYEIRREGFDNVAEWLRRWTANPMVSDRVSSNLIVVEPSIFAFFAFGFFVGVFCA